MILPFRLFRVHLTQHILNEDAVAGCGIIDHNVCHRSHELAVLSDGGA